MFNPHHVEAMVYERQRQVRESAATGHRGAAARRRSRAATPPRHRNRAGRWFSQFAPWRRLRRQTAARPSTTTALMAHADADSSSTAQDRTRSADGDRTGVLAA